MIGDQSNIGMSGVLAVCLFLAAIPLAVVAWGLLSPPSRGVRRAQGAGLAILAGGCLCAATAVPFVVRPGPSVFRPSTTAKISIVSPRPGAVVRGRPAVVSVRIDLHGGKIVPLTSRKLVPNEGHIHLYLDGALVSMFAGTSTTIRAAPGDHTLTAEFVAVDHGPFDPRVRTSVTFRVVS
ncbi:MAG TPA: hypothetical protein VEM41_04260 [Actinomycetota bacterium]|nr:hypothetical protein [Actinomycetota bacterium]